MMVFEDGIAPPTQPADSASCVEALVAGSGSQVAWIPGALDAPLPEYVVRYSQRLAEEAAVTAAAASEEPVAFQRKIVPNADEIHPDANHNAETVAEGAAAGDQGEVELVVIGSLIEDVASLGGLARTCEIFNASNLVLADSLIPTKPQFISTSVTAGRWVPLTFVPPTGLREFLGEARRSGSTVIGVAHPGAVGSGAGGTSLDGFAFPRKTVLLLGDQRSAPRDYTVSHARTVF